MPLHTIEVLTCMMDCVIYQLVASSKQSASS